MASEIWSASLSGWPSATDSDVNTVDESRDMTGPPLKSPTPARSGRGPDPQAPGSSLWDGEILYDRLAQLQVVDAGVPEQLGAAVSQEGHGGGARRVHHCLQVLAFHFPGRGGGGDGAEDHDAGAVAQPLVVAEHLMVQGQL